MLGVYAFVEDKGKVLLTEDVGKPGWKLPGGKVDEGELLEKALSREVREEIGLEVKAVGVVAIGEYVKPGEEHRIRLFFRAKVLAGEISLAIEEVAKYLWVSKEELNMMKEKDFFKDFIYEATRKYLNDDGVLLEDFLITTVRA